MQQATTPSTETLVIEHDDELAVLTLNRPQQRNALSLGLMRELIAALRSIGSDGGARAVVLAANGPAFCAGHDLSEMIGLERDAYRELFDTCTELMLAIHELPQPVVAQVHATATAAGCQLVAACDLALASSAARFATPGVRIGLFCSTPMVEVARAVGRKRAMQLLLTGTPVPASTARDWGLINDVVEPTELPEATRALARRVAAASPLSVALGKRAFYDNVDLDLRGAYAHAKEVMTTNALAADAQEGMCAFLDKRDPVWRGE